MDEIHSRDPYAGFPIDQFAPDLQGWNESSPIFDEVVKVVKPRRVIEVGTWKGASAIRMAQLLKQYGVAGAQIVCVDTWLGSAEHWLERDKPTYDMRPEWGRPTLYQQFIANVIHAGQVDTIIPFPIDSLSAAQFLRSSGCSPMRSTSMRATTMTTSLLTCAPIGTYCARVG
jgi:hypothetical protein